VVDGGWQLNELHALGLSLEEIFLQLTAASHAGHHDDMESGEPVPVEVPAEVATESGEKL
jgi:hypothetical protein